MRVRVRNTSRLRLVHDQIDVAQPIAQLRVGQPVPLVGQRPQRLGQQQQALDPHRQLPGPVRNSTPSAPSDVADVIALEGLVALAERARLQEQLNLAAAVGDLGEARLAHDRARSIMRPPTCTRTGLASSQAASRSA